jgi:hypothetical protein
VPVLLLGSRTRGKIASVDDGTQRVRSIRMQFPSLAARTHVWLGRWLLFPLFASLAACGLIPGYANLSARSAENPLAGGTLAWSHQADRLPFDGEQTCTTWPIEDAVTVHATDKEICVDATIYNLVEASFLGEKRSSLAITSDGSIDSRGGVVVQESAQSFEARPQKVGSCYERPTSRASNVWMSKYTGCVPNTDDERRPLLTTRSTFLELGGKARWKFPEPSAPSKTASR